MKELVLRSIRRPSRRSWMLSIRLAVLASFSSVLFAQTATLHGVVTDESGAVVPGATITLTNRAGVTTTTVTSSDGTYSIRAIAAGEYTAQASAPDLKSSPAMVAIRPGDQTLNLGLKVTAAAQQVTVDEQPATVSIDPANNASATLLKGEDLEALSDNPDDLINDLIAIAGPGAGPGGASVFIDGFTGGLVPAKESIREIRINQNPLSAEYDKIGLGRIEILTKPGTNQLHGSEAFNFGTDSWNSRNPYAQQKAPFLQRELRGNISGSAGKHASFVLDARRDAVDNGAIINGTTLDPTTFGIINPYTNVFRIPQQRWNINPRLDYQIGTNNTATVRYTHSHVGILYAGVGGFNLIARGADTETSGDEIQATETSVLSANTVNEIRFRFSQTRNETTPNTLGPAIQVLGAFNAGAVPGGHSFDTLNNLEFQNNVSIVHGAHSFRFGARLRRTSDDNVGPQNFAGTFTFGGGTAPVLDANNQPVLDTSGQPLLTPITSIERYRRTLLFQSMGFSSSQISALGGGATQFSLTSGNPALSASQFDISPFLQDDWKVHRTLTLSLGFRYEVQTNISDHHDFAPRVAIAWSPQMKTVIRAGAGMFYDRFALGNTMTALRGNGIRQQQYIITNPDFFPAIPAIGSLAGFQAAQLRQQISANLQAPTYYQSVITVERQLPLNTTLAVSYANTHGLHMLHSRDINAPLPGTFDPAIPGSGTYPLGPVGAVYLMESAGLYNQNQLILNVNARPNKYISLTGSYTLNRAMSNTDGLGTFAANPYSMVGEYGPAATDVRHRLSLNGTINTKWNVAFNPLVNLVSGPPFDVTAGQDVYGTTLFNARPGIATDPNRPGVILTAYGLLDPNSTPDETILHRNYGRGPGSVSFNLRVGKTVNFGPALEQAAQGGSRSTARRRYNMIFTMEMQNLLNHNNPGPITGNITSPIFGHANQPAGGGGGFGGWSEAATNRRFEFQTRFTF
jgi:hypothetical protein